MFDKHSSTVWLRNIYNSITGLTSLYRLTSSRSCCRSCSTSISFSSTRDKRTRSVSNICSSRWSSSVSSAFCCSSWTRASLICRHMTLTVEHKRSNTQFISGLENLCKMSIIQLRRIISQTEIDQICLFLACLTTSQKSTSACARVKARPKLVMPRSSSIVFSTNMCGAFCKTLAT